MPYLVNFLYCAISFDLTDKNQIEIINSTVSTLLFLMTSPNIEEFIKFGYYSIFLYLASDGHY